jgi:hypothetical protein
MVLPAVRACKARARARLVQVAFGRDHGFPGGEQLAHRDEAIAFLFERSRRSGDLGAFPPIDKDRKSLLNTSADSCPGAF